MDQEEYIAESIQRKFKLPKLVAREIQQAKSSLNDSNMTIKNIISLHVGNKTEHHSRVQKKKTKNKLNFSNIIQKLESMDQQAAGVQFEKELISHQMEKYKPKNGSHSNLLTDRSVQDEKIKQYYKMKKPNFGFKSKTQNKSRVYFSRKSTLGSEANSILEIDLAKKSKQQYIEKLKNLRQASELVRIKSRFLHEKAIIAKQLTLKKYDKLKDSTDVLITGDEKYTLEEQFSKTYMRKFNERMWSIPKLLK